MSTETRRPSVIAQLRALAPDHGLDRGKALRLSELQAERLLRAMNVRRGPVPTSIISELPRIHVQQLAMAVSGAASWSNGQWVITVNSAESPQDNRFTVAHELKHILDHPTRRFMYPSIDGESPSRRAEQMANHFAASLLMPRAWVTWLWELGIRDPSYLARHFDVSLEDMEVRLRAIGLETAPPP